jgi:hypothetical protein
LSRCFRHHRCLHGRLFRAVANVVQATLMLEGGAFQVRYNDNNAA